MDDESSDYPGQIPPNAILRSSLSIGALSGSSGLLLGAVVGTFRSPRPGIFALASGIQWFALGTTFWASRAFILNTQTTPTSPLTPIQRTYASTLSGALSGGSIGYLVRGRSSILPGTLLFSLLGFAGQSLYIRLDAQHTRSIIDATNSSEKRSIFQRLAAQKWSPMSILTDEEYVGMLREKVLKVDAEIAILDEDLDALRKGEGINKREEAGTRG